MKHITRTIVLGLLIAAMTALTATPAGASHQVERPFKGQSIVILTVDPDCDLSQGVCGFTTVDTGNASHLGKIVTTSEGVLTLTGACILADGSSVGVAFATAGTFIHTAANGDQVEGTFENQGCVGLTPDTAAIPGRIDGSQVISGGTGRFAGASGQTITFSDGIGPFNWVGTITY